MALAITNDMVSSHHIILGHFYVTSCWDVTHLDVEILFHYNNVLNCFFKVLWPSTTDDMLSYVIFFSKFTLLLEF